MSFIRLDRENGTMFALETIREVLVASKAFNEAKIEFDEIKLGTSDTQEEDKNGAFRTISFKGEIVLLEAGARSTGYRIWGALTVCDASGRGEWQEASGNIFMRTTRGERNFSYTRQINGDLKIDDGTHLKIDVMF